MLFYKVLFYGGMAAAVCSALAGAAALMVFRRWTARLRGQLEAEYGEAEKR